MDDPLSLSIIAIIALLLAAVVRLAEVAISYIDEGEAQRQADAGDAKSKRALRLARRAEGADFGEYRMAWACLFLISAFAVCQIRGKLWWALAVRLPLDALALSQLACVIILVPFTLVFFILAGVVPGHLAAHFRDKLFNRVSAVCEWTLIVLTPITRLALWLGAALLKPFHIKPAGAGDAVTEEDIMQMVDIGEEKGAIESDEREMIENIFEFNNMDAGDCMIHRKDITAVDIDATNEEIMNLIRESGRSRFPVYEDSLDNVQGILFTRDFLLDQCEGGHTPLRQLIRPAHFVPESVRTDVLFKEMQTRKQHIAIVVDEYGGTSGLITLEDLLEEIVGNIYDEFDPKEDEDIQPLGENKWRISGAADLETIAETLKIDLPTDEEFDTLGGLVFSRLTEIPADGARPVVECFGLRISVEEVADRRVEWAIVEKIQDAEKEQDDN